MHAKYQVAIFNIAKVIANVKVGANKQTNQKPTNRQGKNNIAVGDIKITKNIKALSLRVMDKLLNFFLYHLMLNKTTAKQYMSHTSSTIVRIFIDFFICCHSNQNF
jgi:hypothetical protein